MQRKERLSFSSFFLFFSFCGFSEWRGLCAPPLRVKVVFGNAEQSLVWWREATAFNLSSWITYILHRATLSFKLKTFQIIVLDFSLRDHLVIDCRFLSWWAIKRFQFLRWKFKISTNFEILQCLKPGQRKTEADFLLTVGKHVWGDNEHYP